MRDLPGARCAEDVVGELAAIAIGYADQERMSDNGILEVNFRNARQAIAANLNVARGIVAELVHPDCLIEMPIRLRPLIAGITRVEDLTAILRPSGVSSPGRVLHVLQHFAEGLA